MIRLALLLLAVLLTACANPAAPPVCEPWIYVPIVDAYGQVLVTARVKICQPR